MLRYVKLTLSLKRMHEETKVDIQALARAALDEGEGSSRVTTA
jgi:hypothetical protein